MITKHRSKRFLLTIAVCVLITTGTGIALAQDEDEDANAILGKMSDAIAGLDAFIISGDGYTDDRLDAGQIVEHSMDVTMRMNRAKDAFRITNSDAESTKEIYFGSGVLTVYNQSNNFYAQTEAPDSINAAARFAVDELGIDAPMLDLVSNDVASYLVEDAQSVDYLGLSLFRDKTYHHIAIRSAELDLQFWVAAVGPPLPGKMAISAKWEGGSPRSVYFFSWDTEPEFERDSFSFEPPAGSVRIEFDLDLDQ